MRANPDPKSGSGLALARLRATPDTGRRSAGEFWGQFRSTVDELALRRRLVADHGSVAGRGRAEEAGPPGGVRAGMLPRPRRNAGQGRAGGSHQHQNPKERGRLRPAPGQAPGGQRSDRPAGRHARRGRGGRCIPARLRQQGRQAGSCRPVPDPRRGQHSTSQPATERGGQGRLQGGGRGRRGGHGVCSAGARRPGHEGGAGDRPRRRPGQRQAGVGHLPAGARTGGAGRRLRRTGAGQRLHRRHRDPAAGLRQGTDRILPQEIPDGHRAVVQCP